MLPVLAQTDVNLALPGIVALIAGILILLVPGMLRWIVGLYLVVVGLIQILGLSV